MKRIQDHAPYPPSEVVTGLRWDDDIVRLGGERAGDNWPMAWGDDNLIYTSLGDGNGFAPRDRDYTLAFATVSGTPPHHGAWDFPSNIDTLVGWGQDGIKASGMIMVGGTLYLWVRNHVVGVDDSGRPDWRHSRLACSHDRGRTWTWADWHLSDGFGCPEFVQFGPNYAGARDDYVYVVSQDGNSAYDLDPGIAMARVPVSDVMHREAYEFFTGTDAAGRPTWSNELSDRVPIFTDPRGTQRVAITYSAPLRRYFLTTVHGVPSGIPHTPALGVFDAPEPWGPWTTVYYHDEWSEQGWMIHHKFPTKWMSRDGKSIWLVFSGQHRDGGIDYCLLARRAVLTT